MIKVDLALLTEIKAYIKGIKALVKVNLAFLEDIKSEIKGI